MAASNYLPLITVHSREAIVDINTSATKLSSGGRSNYSNITVGSAVFMQEKQHNNQPSWVCGITTFHHIVKPKPHQ